MRSNRTRHHALCTAVAMAASMLALMNSLACADREIVVTARKREENLQDVPMAISAFTARAAAEQPPTTSPTCRR